MAECSGVRQSSSSQFGFAPEGETGLLIDSVRSEFGIYIDLSACGQLLLFILTMLIIASALSQRFIRGTSQFHGKFSCAALASQKRIRISKGKSRNLDALSEYIVRGEWGILDEFGNELKPRFPQISQRSQ